MVVVRGRLAPQVGAALLQALAAARETLSRQTINVSYETSSASGRPFRDDDVVAEPFEAADVVTADARGVAALEVVGPEVVVGDPVLEHVPEGHDHRVLHGHDGLLGAAPGFEPVI